MAGTFAVTFHFEEHDALAPGYSPRAPYHEEGTEVVSVLTAAADHVVLQHVLLLADGEGGVVAMKHWRQDWTFAPTEAWRFVGQAIWAHTALAPATDCVWQQSVHGVTDAPRYTSEGRWSHAGGRSMWASEPTWRPLPRREADRSHEYDVLAGRNVHVVEAAGWQHLQDNVKLVLDGQRALTREQGRNVYRRTADVGEAAAHAYLAATGPYWAGVRAAWGEVMAATPRLRVTASVDGVPLWAPLFDLAEASEPCAARVDAARAAVRRYVEPLPAAGAAPVEPPSPWGGAR